ncbi:hypothetical protein WJX73_006445 [Symbiochloris irregularis]|uniref:Mitochondrial carrier protein n=1 Tax=Symbiochloris irregularis TaxID=706552 RepID=A0AAW1NU19_9CHLO
MSRGDPNDIDWSRLDKQKFIVYGAGLFSGVTVCLFPLSVIKTRQMAVQGAPSGLSGAVQVARGLVKHDGVRGLYKGFGTVMVGVLPARVLYLSTLEATKAMAYRHAEASTPNPTAAAAAANFAAGGTASLVTQCIIVPVDVISQRLMILGGTERSSGDRPPRLNGWNMARAILRAEGVRGLYRGFGLSVVTFVPSSAVWWSAYGGYQKAIWRLLDRRRAQQGNLQPIGLQPPSTSSLLTVQTMSALAAGATSACLTNPLDVLKTRLQVAQREAGGQRPTMRATARQLLQEDGPRGLLRGLLPRMVNVSMWGTAMVTCYEFLKRLSEKPGP